MPKKEFNMFARRKKKPRSKSKVTKKALTNGAEKEVKSIVSDQLNKKAETKYLNDLLNEPTHYSHISPEVDQVNHRALFDITPTIMNGDGYFQREGDQIDLRNYQVRMRIHPYRTGTVWAQGVTPATNPYEETKYLTCYLLRVDATAVINAGQVDYCIRRPMENWMDTRQTQEREHKKAFTIVGKSFKIPIKYKYTIGLDSSTVPAEYNVDNIPCLSYVNKTFKINKKTFFNTHSLDEPVKYKYKLFMTWGNYFRDAYEDLTFPDMYIWNSWTFKDI